jgi:hypothetical protein
VTNIAYSSGDGNNFGDVFKISPPAPGQTAWTKTTVHRFDYIHGGNPGGGLLHPRLAVLSAISTKGRDRSAILGPKHVVRRTGRRRS